MELVLFLSILLQSISQPATQTDTSPAPDVEVLRFSWHEFRRPFLDPRMDEYPSINKTQQRVFTEETNNRNSIENRSRDMRVLEQRAAIRDGGKPGAEYRYSTELKNKSDKIIRAVFWDYQSGEVADPDSLSHRQFRCGVKIKPNENKTIEAFLRVPASRVIVAATGKRPPERVVVNRVEFADGTFWQRADWLAPEEVMNLTGGGCRGF